MPYILAIDQGTTNTRAILFNADGRVEHAAQRELPQMYPRDGWVEHDPREIWNATRDVCSQILSRDDVSAENVAAIGITNQRETTVLWDRGSGQPLHNAIVWQDRRTADTCRKFKESGYESMVQKKTGLLIDPYFSASKIAWLLDAVPGARTAAKSGTLAFGTIDCFLLWHLTGGRVHATDASNAARTMLFNIHSQAWDQDLLQLFDIPKEILPEVLDCSGLFGVTDRDSFGAEIPITGMAGDQQAAAFGQACFQPGMIKSTYGTGCFVLLNTGNEAIPSNNRLLSTVAYRLKGKTTYAVEGSIFIAGAAIQWLRDGLGVISHAADSEALARGIDHTGGVYLVPAFTGLGAPYWDPAARGAIFGLTRDSGVSELVRAALESVCYQTRDL
ncbi:MAG: glycerol kinase GlpK, partial [Rhodospirillales bacterium]|nr:glycerol kinase GlpK [Rhodospirillales bacterium]